MTVKLKLKLKLVIANGTGNDVLRSLPVRRRTSRLASAAAAV